MGLLGLIIVGLAAVWVCFLASSIFLRRAYTELGKRLNVHLFSTAALVYMIGAALTIILVGFIVIYIAEILLMVAFFSINTEMPPATQPVQSYPPTV